MNVWPRAPPPYRRTAQGCRPGAMPPPMMDNAAASPARLASLRTVEPRSISPDAPWPMIEIDDRLRQKSALRGATIWLETVAMAVDD